MNNLKLDLFSSVNTVLINIDYKIKGEVEGIEKDNEEYYTELLSNLLDSAIRDVIITFSYIRLILDTTPALWGVIENIYSIGKYSDISTVIEKLGKGVKDSVKIS